MPQRVSLSQGLAPLPPGEGARRAGEGQNGEPSPLGEDQNKIELDLDQSKLWLLTLPLIRLRHLLPLGEG